MFLDLENVPAQGPLMPVGNHLLLGRKSCRRSSRGLEVLRGLRVRGLADYFHFAGLVGQLWRGARDA